MGYSAKKLAEQVGKGAMPKLRATCKRILPEGWEIEVDELEWYYVTVWLPEGYSFKENGARCTTSTQVEDILSVLGEGYTNDNHEGYRTMLQIAPKDERMSRVVEGWESAWKEVV